MNDLVHFRLVSVHCRTGSLEIVVVLLYFALVVHCRTGSLENSFQNIAGQ